jgi:hypothetical protein
LLKAAKVADTAMSEAKGSFGSKVQQAIADDNLHADAFRLIRKYEKKDPAAFTAFWQALDTYADYAKFAKADLVDQMHGDDESKARKPAATKDHSIHGDNIAQFAQVGAA